MTEQFEADNFLESDEDRLRDRKKSRRTLWCCVLALLVPLIAVSLVVAGYLNRVNNAYEKQVEIVEITESEQSVGEGTNILLLGSDKRDPDSGENVTGQRSDVIMWVHISADNQSAYVASFPRDLYIDVPGHGKDRINAALAYGGVPLAVHTIENYVGTKIDHVMLVDFDGIKAIVDTLGGVDVEIPVTFEGDGVQFTQGIQHLNGDEALTFARQRYQFARGDFQRNENQRALLKAIVEKILSRDTLTDPGKILALTEDISPHLTVDSGLTSARIVELGLANRGIRGANIHYLSVPHGDPFMTSGGASVVATDDEGMAEFSTALREGTLEEYVSKNR